MRHGTGTYFTRFNLLLEIFHRDVLPEVAVHVNHNGIDAFHRIKNGSQIIIIRDLPAQWDLQFCIDYALEQNITIRKNRVTAESTQIDVKTAKAALFPSLSFSTSQQVVNRPYQETSSRVSGSEIISSNSKTSYNGNYGLNASWTIYNGSKRLKTLKQERLNNQVAELECRTLRKIPREELQRIAARVEALGIPCPVA